MPEHPFTSFSGLDLLSSSVILLDERLAITYMNPAAENLLATSVKLLAGRLLPSVLTYSQTLEAALNNALRHAWSYTGQNIELRSSDGESLHVNCTVNPTEAPGARLLVELWPIDQQLKVTREERLIEQQQANRELIRNLAHEIKNPLGGIRGAAQLLDRELENPALHEYTQVIMKEADRLQALMSRLLSPHRIPRPTHLNIHEVLERVRSVLLAEFHKTISIQRDYDVSLPYVYGDNEQLIQAMLNVARNAAQALTESGATEGVITLKTRAARQVTLARKRYRHAIEVSITDNGPGIPPEISERVFYPLVSGRDTGSGLGLTIAQNFVSQHNGTLTFESAPGKTCFTVLLPVAESPEHAGQGQVS